MKHSDSRTCCWLEVRKFLSRYAYPGKSIITSNCHSFNRSLQLTSLLRTSLIPLNFKPTLLTFIPRLLLNLRPILSIVYFHFRLHLVFRHWSTNVKSSLSYATIITFYPGRKVSDKGVHQNITKKGITINYFTIHVLSCLQFYSHYNDVNVKWEAWNTMLSIGKDWHRLF